MKTRPIDREDPEGETKMTKARLLRWAGLAGLGSGVLLVLLEIAFLVIVGDQPDRVAAASADWVVLTLLSMLAAYLGLLALIGFYARQAQESGQLGLIGFVLASIGMVMNIGFLWAGAFVVPALTSAAPAFLDRVESDPPGIVAAGFISTFALFSLGWFAFGGASLRAKVLSRPAASLISIGAPLAFVFAYLGLPLGGVVFGLGMAGLGWWLSSDKPASPSSF